MNIKLIFKISVLIFALGLVLVGRKFFSSVGFKKNATDIFAVEAHSFQWCSPQHQKFLWTEARLTQKFSALTATQLAKKFCLVYAETIQGVDLQKVQWSPIAESVDGEGQKVILERNLENKLFRADGLPFKSSSLGREINP